MKVFVAFALGCVMGLLLMDMMKASRYEEEYQEQRIRLHLNPRPQDFLTQPPIFEEEDNPPPPPPAPTGTWI